MLPLSSTLSALPCSPRGIESTPEPSKTLTSSYKYITNRLPGPDHRPLLDTPTHWRYKAPYRRRRERVRPPTPVDRKSVVEGKSVDLGGRRIIKKKTIK